MHIAARSVAQQPPTATRLLFESSLMLTLTQNKTKMVSLSLDNQRITNNYWKETPKDQPLYRTGSSYLKLLSDHIGSTTYYSSVTSRDQPSEQDVMDGHKALSA